LDAAPRAFALCVAALSGSAQPLGRHDLSRHDIPSNEKKIEVSVEKNNNRNQLYMAKPTSLLPVRPAQNHRLIP
jgi:hypothetical protein